jgi:hypothetical protein
MHADGETAGVCGSGVPANSAALGQPAFWGSNRAERRTGKAGVLKASSGSGVFSFVDMALFSEFKKS